jgi:CRP-like cAMP-binding protein
MDRIRQFLKNIINITEEELDMLLRDCYIRQYKRSSIVAEAKQQPNEVYFINNGLIRVFLADGDGVEHTIYFAMQDQFIADYSSFILKQKANFALQALAPTSVVVIPRKVIDWGYANLNEGEKLGRLIAEGYFIYQENKTKDQYIKTPKERYEGIVEIFPNIINLVPQHMIASYLGITPVHLSRLKNPFKT